MKTIIIRFLVLFIVPVTFFLQSLPAQDRGLFRNPVVPGEFADPTVIRIGNSWYAAGTSSEWAPYYPLYQSEDLVNWKQIGHVFDEQPEWTLSSFWAPELFYYNDKIYVYYTARNKAGVTYMGVAVAEDTNFNFVDYGIIVEWGSEAIDAFVLEDEGNLYISWKAYGLDERPIELLACKLSADGLRMEGEPFFLMRDDEGIGMEGQHWFKKDDYYYMVYSVKSCCGPGSDYEVYVARSKKLEGPYEKYEKNPILKGDGKQVQSCGHGTFTDTPDGRMYYLFHAYLAGTGFYGGRQGMLQEMVIDRDQWPAFVTGNEPQLIQKLPFSRTIQKRDLSINDEFSSAQPAVYWTWNYPYSDVDAQIKGGKLYLSGTPKGEYKTGAAYCVRPVVPDYCYETKVAESNAALKGLTFYGDAEHLIVWGSQNDKLQLKEIKGGNEVVLYEVSPGTPTPYLRIDIKDGTFASFYWSKNGKNWEKVPQESRDLAPLVRWDRVARPGLLHQGNPAEPGVFNFFRMVEM